MCVRGRPATNGQPKPSKGKRASRQARRAWTDRQRPFRKSNNKRNKSNGAPRMERGGSIALSLAPLAGGAPAAHGTPRKRERWFQVNRPRLPASLHSGPPQPQIKAHTLQTQTKWTAPTACVSSERAVPRGSNLDALSKDRRSDRSNKARDEVAEVPSLLLRANASRPGPDSTNHRGPKFASHAPELAQTSLYLRQSAICSVPWCSIAA